MCGKLIVKKASIWTRYGEKIGVLRLFRSYSAW